MKPITTTNLEGRALLALRAGPMTTSEINERLNGSLPGWLIKAGLVVISDSHYRITDAGRVACPYRNPLAAPGGVQPITVKPEVEMSKENVVTRQQVLAAIEAAGPSGISPKFLIAAFGCSDSVIYNHISLLSKQQPPVIFKPKTGLVCAIKFQQGGMAKAASEKTPPAGRLAMRTSVLEWLEGKPASTEAAIAEGIGCTRESTNAVLQGLVAAQKIQLITITGQHLFSIQAASAAPDIKVAQSKLATPPAAAVVIPAVVSSDSSAKQALITMSPEIDLETIEVKGIPDRRAQTKIDVDADDLEIGIFTDGSMDFLVDDGLDDAHIKLTSEAVTKLRRFLGLFQEAA